MTTQDGSAKFKIKDMRTHHMCGEIVALVTTPPDYEHLLLCDGQTISTNDYPELVAALGSNVLPNLNGRVLQGGSTAGEYKEAGLPNIEGSGGSVFGGGAVGTGAFVRTPVSKEDGGLAKSAIDNSSQAIDNRYAFLHFDASRCSAIYGASSTVQPPAYTVRYYICYG